MSRIKAKLPTISEDDESASALVKNSTKLPADSTDICQKRRPAADKKKGVDERKNKMEAVVESEESSGIPTKVKEREERSGSWQPALLQPKAQVTRASGPSESLFSASCLVICTGTVPATLTASSIIIHT
jgi:hypothetical protein